MIYIDILVLKEMFQPVPRPNIINEPAVIGTPYVIEAAIGCPVIGGIATLFGLYHLLARPPFYRPVAAYAVDLRQGVGVWQRVKEMFLGPE